MHLQKVIIPSGQVRQYRCKIDELASLAHPRDGKSKHQFVMLEVYFDESGIEKSAPLCIVAGYCAGQLDWRKCETRWRRALDKEGIETFHSKEFWGRYKGNRVKPYEGWTDERANKFLERLVCAIEQYGLMPIAHGIVVADWNRFDLLRTRDFIRILSQAEMLYHDFRSKGLIKHGKERLKNNR